VAGRLTRQLPQPEAPICNRLSSIVVRACYDFGDATPITNPRWRGVQTSAGWALRFRGGGCAFPFLTVKTSGSDNLTPLSYEDSGEELGGTFFSNAGAEVGERLWLL
jgi:hypothetical protein